MHGTIQTILRTRYDEPHSIHQSNQHIKWHWLHLGRIKINSIHIEFHHFCFGRICLWTLTVLDRFNVTAQHSTHTKCTVSKIFNRFNQALYCVRDGWVHHHHHSQTTAYSSGPNHTHVVWTKVMTFTPRQITFAITIPGCVCVSIWSRIQWSRNFHSFIVCMQTEHRRWVHRFFQGNFVFQLAENFSMHRAQYFSIRFFYNLFNFIRNIFMMCISRFC